MLFLNLCTLNKKSFKNCKILFLFTVHSAEYLSFWQNWFCFLTAELKTHWSYSDNTNTISIAHLIWPISPSILNVAALTFECLWTCANTSILSPGTCPFPDWKNCINLRSLILFLRSLTMERWWKRSLPYTESRLTWSKLLLFPRFVSPSWAS